MEFEEIYTKYSKQVYNLALHYLQNTEDAQEVTQDVFVTIFQKINSFNGASKLSTWIYRITVNHALDFLKAKRRKKRFAVLTSLFHPQSNQLIHELFHLDHPGVSLEDQEAIEQIFSAINQLPDKQKTAIILTKIEGMSQDEAAHVMEMTPKAVESLIQRAKHNLKKINPKNDGK